MADRRAHEWTTIKPYPELMNELHAMARRARELGDAEALAKVQEFMGRAQQMELDRYRQETVANMSGTERAVTAFGEGARHAIRQAAGLVPGGPSDEEILEASELNRPLAQASPKASLAGGASIAVPTAVALGAPTMGAGAAVAIPANAALGALHGAAFSDPGQRGESALIGGGLGGGATLISALGKGAAYGIQPKGAGLTLSKMGFADDLTPGQINPGGAFNKFENAMESLPWAGGAVTKARAKGAAVLQKALGREVVPPGSTPPSALNKSEWYRQALQEFEPVYDRIAEIGQVVPGAKRWQSMIRSAQQVPGMNSAAAKKVDSIITKALEPIKRKGANVGWKDIQSVRSYIRNARDAYRTSAAADDKLIGSALREAESVLTAELESALPANMQQLLRDTDRAYSNLMVARDTIDNMRLGGGETISPAKFAAEVWKRLPASTVAKGEGGSLRELAETGLEAFSPRSPETGARLATLGALGIPAAMVGEVPVLAGTLAAARAAYTPTGMRILKGMTPIQQAAQRFFAGLPAQTGPGARSALLEALREGRLGARPELLGAIADDEEQSGR